MAWILLRFLVGKELAPRRATSEQEGDLRAASQTTHPPTFNKQNTNNTHTNMVNKEFRFSIAVPSTMEEFDALANTPGPWKIGTVELHDSDVQDVSKAIVQVFEHLLAAAPDLLSGCRDAEQWLQVLHREMWHNGERSGARRDDLIAAIKSVQAVIAKSEGREP